MRRSILALVGAVGELVRYLGLIALSRSFLGSAGENGAFALFHFAASAQLLFALGFFFLWYKPHRYGSYRPLLAAGKLLSVLSLAPLTVRFALTYHQEGLLSGNPVAMLIAMVAFLAWDIAAGVILLISLKKLSEESKSPRTDPALSDPASIE